MTERVNKCTTIQILPIRPWWILTLMLYLLVPTCYSYLASLSFDHNRTAFRTVPMILVRTVPAIVYIRPRYTASLGL